MIQTDFIAALPLIILAGTGLIVLLWDAFEKIPSRIPLFLTVTGAIAAAIVAGYNLQAESYVAFGGLFLNSGYSNFFTIIFSAATILTAVLAERYLHEQEVLIGEFCALLLFAASGMVMMSAGANLIVTFLGLETMSIAFYILCGLFRTKEESNESALKYFLLGAFATGFFLYGIALIYGSFGSMSLIDIHNAVVSGVSKSVSIYTSPILLLGVILLLVGFAFKVAAFPFHQWAPDVYEGAPTIVSGYLSTAGKAAAFSAFVLIFGHALIPEGTLNADSAKIQLILAALAACSMLYGNIVAIAQTKIKRMLAYSSTAHAGYLLLGVAAFNRSGATGIGIYSAVYLLMQISAFGMVALLEKETGTGLDLEDYVGLGKRRPYAALILSVIMLSLAGIPPFAGFFGKYYLFMAAIEAHMTWLAIVGVVSSIIGSYFYLRVIVLMYFRDPVHADDVIAVKENTISYIAIGLASIILVVFGLMPGLLTNAAGYFFK